MDWDAFDTLVPRAEDRLHAEPEVPREEMTRFLMAEVEELRAEDPAGVVARVVRAVLGTPERPAPRPAPGGAADRPPED